SIGMPPTPPGQDFQYSVNVTGRFNEARDFEGIVVKVDNQAGGRITRVRDIARVELGAQTYSQNFTLNGAPAAGIGIFQLPDANAIVVANGVRAKMDDLAKAFPPGLAYTVPFDTTVFVKASINEVYVTLIEAGILVLSAI